MELTPHVVRRMVQRGFSETDLRTMLPGASAIRPSEEVGRWTAVTSLGPVPWVVVVEPDPDERLLVITAYPVDPP